MCFVVIYFFNFYGVFVGKPTKHIRLKSCFIEKSSSPQIHKSVLAYIAKDFPELAETIYYSPLMEELDEIIGSNFKIQKNE